MSLIDRIPFRRIMSVGRPAVEKLKLDKMRTLMFANAVNQHYKHTPDWEKLELHPWTPVFVYCNAVHGGARFDVIQDIYDRDRVHTAYTSDRYELYQNQLGKDSFPVALRSKAKTATYLNGCVPNSPRAARVKGRLYFIRSVDMYLLDNLKMNGVMFRRRLVDIDIPYTIEREDEDVVRGQAWMYIGKRTHWDGIIDSGYHFPPCPLHDHTVRERHGVTFRIPPKKWFNDEELYYMFHAWEVANK